MSSDSDDDCYGNIAQKLERMKNKYQEDKIESTNLLNESAELDEFVQKTIANAKTVKEPTPDSPDYTPGPSVSIQSDVAQDKEVKSKSKRVTRSSAKSQNLESSISENLPPRRPGRRKRGADTSISSDSPSRRGRDHGKRDTAASTEVNPSPRGRGRRGGSRTGRGRGSSSRNRSVAATIPTYSIGDADDVPDMSENQALFSNTKHKDDIVVVEDNDPLDENEELSVKVYWQSCEFFRFTIRKYQKLSQIFDYFSKNKAVSVDKLLFTYNEKIITPNDTPESIDYNIVKFIEGGIVNQSVTLIASNDSEKITDGVKIKFQCQNVKKPFEITIRLDDKFSLAMMKCAEHLEIPQSNLRFEFDGDCISGKNTARDLELEGGECIDVKIVS